MEGVVTSALGGLIPVSPDGSRAVLGDPRGGFSLFRTDGGPPEPIPGLATPDVPLELCDDGRSLFIGHRDGATWHVLKLDLETGRATPWTEIRPAEVAGLRLSWVYITPNGRFWIHGYSRLLTDLYTVQGLL